MKSKRVFFIVAQFFMLRFFERYSSAANLPTRHMTFVAFFLNSLNSILQQKVERLSSIYFRCSKDTHNGLNPNLRMKLFEVFWHWCCHWTFGGFQIRNSSIFCSVHFRTLDLKQTTGYLRDTVDAPEIWLTSWYGKYMHISHDVHGFIHPRWLFCDIWTMGNSGCCLHTHDTLLEVK